MNLASIFLVAGGLGLFLFGMKMMSTGIETIAGDRLHGILKRATSNRFFAVTVGILATIAINSSTATTIMTVSFVNSGLMNLVQAIGVIMGANVGTTFSAQLVAFRIDTYAPIFIFIGVILHVFFRKKSIKNVGYIILGFGILFFGITTMGQPLRELAQDPAFNSMLVTFENPFLALLTGFLFTAIVQSSSATMGLLVTLHISGAPIPLETSAFIILGTNIGTSITTVIASIPASRESKRAALFHIMFDIIGSIVFGTLIFIFPGILGWFQSTWAESGRQVAMFHTLYNFATLFLILPFVRPVALLMQKIVPIDASSVTDVTYERRLVYLDTKIMLTPSLAIRNAHLEICRMIKIANETLNTSLSAFFEKDIEKAKPISRNKETIYYLTRKTAARLVKINNASLSQPDAKLLGKMFRILYNIERLGDHAENIAEYTAQIVDNDINFSPAAADELQRLGKLATSITAESLEAFDKQEAALLTPIHESEDVMVSLAAQFTENHIERQTNEVCEPRAGVVFTDMIIDLGRCASHASNIAVSMVPGAARKRRKSSKKLRKKGK